MVGQVKGLTGVAGVSGTDAVPDPRWVHGSVLAGRKGKSESCQGHGGAANSIPCVDAVLARDRAGR